MQRVLYAGLVAALAITGCDATSSLAWRIRFESAADRGDARRLHATARRGACDGEIVYEVDLVSGGTASMDAPDLPPGVYSFAAEAVDASCRMVATGCVTIELPQDAEAVDLVLASAARTDTCPDGMCTDGICGACGAGGCGADGGMDASLDAGADGGSPPAGDAGPDAGEDAGTDAGFDAGPMLPAPAVIAPWNGWNSGAAIAPVGTGAAVLADHPLQPEIRWRAVTDAASYLVELVRCSDRDVSSCSFATPTARIVTDASTLRARPASQLPVELTTPPLGAHYAFRVGACAEAAGRGCTFAAPRGIEVGRLRQDVDGDAIGDLFIVGQVGTTQELRRATSPSSTTMVTSANVIRSVAWVGDYDGDGIGELAIGTDGVPGGRLAFLDDGVEAGVVDEATATTEFADVIAGLDDVDGDGYADFAASAVGEAEVRVFLGGPTFDGARAIIVPAPSGVTSFGGAIAGVGDRDGDGLADLAIAARTGTDTARIFVYSLRGRTAREVSREMLFTGEVAGSPVLGLPMALAGGADMDDDGVPEVIVGRRVLEDVVVLFASSVDSESLTGEAGTSVAIGDIDGTGSARAIVGGPTAVDSIGGMDGTSWHLVRDAGGFISIRIRFINFSGSSRYGEEVSVLDIDGNGREDAIVLDGTGDSVQVAFYDPDAMRINPGGRIYFASGGVSRWLHVAR
ncbi:MAG: VCBS repeat-containing protein [Sandaracinaceae bacterium]|nr:VCBS repeat-containing protein [Sandaracinaceae bacterium]